MKNNLQMSLKTKWFEMTNTPNGKTEEYREINEYWCRRLLYKIPFIKGRGSFSAMRLILSGDYKCNEWKEFTGGAPIFRDDIETNTMTLGYPKSIDKERIKIFEHAGIEIGFGKPEWGAEPNKLYFIIKHGKRLQ